MVALKVNTLLPDNSGNRQEIHVQLRSQALWRAAMHTQRPSEKYARPAEKTRNNRRMAVVSGELRSETLMAEKTLVSKRTHACGCDTDSDVSSRKSSVDADDIHLLVRVDENGEQDMEVTQHRIEALEILEGKRQPVPDRDYTGMYAPAFRRMALEEQRADEARLRARLVLKNITAAARNQPRGWAFLREALVSNLSEEDAAKFLPWNPEQRGYLLTVDAVNGKRGVRKVLNLDTCSRSKLRIVMEGVAARGWVDVVWVTDPKEMVPYLLEKKEDVTAVVHWGGEASHWIDLDL
ncbi:hypothetical protein G7046_g1704 [Stylonectria norvegica]|nr:hypothetical protein G7046_g1704 [Stylonectria norvegica]